MAGVPTIGKTGSPLLARIRNAITSDACQLMSPKTALRGRHSHSIFVSRLCENVHEPRVPRIVFSIAFFRQKLPVQLVSTSTKSRWKFYTQVRRGSFHTAWVNFGPLRV